MALRGTQRLRFDGGSRATLDEVASFVVDQIPAPSGGGGGYVPVPGLPSKFVRWTHHDDGSQIGHQYTLPITGTEMTTGDQWFYFVQGRASFTGHANDYCIFATNGLVGFNSTAVPPYLDSTSIAVAVKYSQLPNSDSSFFVNQGGFVDVTGSAPFALTFTYTNMHSGVPVDLTIDVQLIAVAPATFPTTATGL